MNVTVIYQGDTKYIGGLKYGNTREKTYIKKISKKASEELGCGVDVCLNSVNISKHNGKRKIHISIDAETDQRNIKKIIKNIKK